ncbi:YcfL family protein [Klebsiella sp. BIGb0407]|uniref:YcfL family protein n=1 Tax=Klebsiella sp. BIGb0407 TaxID=2940603 RepID=UPI0021684571|nr:DUF1425 domain-containing protein [Klebsiella sp. BIGb0407]MCS3433620.1 uncharacterized protein YcfL [Klebsiella sp. BIGb0407]
MRKTIGPLMLVLAIAGCSSRPGIPVSDTQTLVMEGAILAAGIRASSPTLSQRDGTAVALSSLYNEKQHPVRLYYRFYWYDAKGLEIHPADKVQELQLDAESGKQIQSTLFNPDASKVRLFLSLRSEL